MDNKQKVYAIVEPTYEYDDERYYEVGETVSQLYAKQEDAEKAIRWRIISNMREREYVAEAIKSRFYDEAISPEMYESLKGILGENAITVIPKEGFYLLRGFDWDVLNTVDLDEEQAKHLASLIGYDPYAVKEMVVW